MSDLSTHLPQRLNRPEDTGLDPGLLVPLLRLLVDGDPVTMEQLATAAGRALDEVRHGLAAVPDSEYDDQGRIIGQGLTLRPTPHRFTVAGVELYTWCALDTLIFPALLDRLARVESVSPTSGDPIRLTVDPTDGVTSLEPATAMVSLVNPKQIASIRSSFCNQVHYFTCADDAAGWLAEHPGAEVAPVAEAYRIGAALTAGLLLGAGAAILMVACCAVLPILVVGGSLAGVGAVLGNPWVIGAGGLLAATALGYVLARRRGKDGVCDECCQPGVQDDGSAAAPEEEAGA